MAFHMQHTTGYMANLFNRHRTTIIGWSDMALIRTTYTVGKQRRFTEAAVIEFAKTHRPKHPCAFCGAPIAEHEQLCFPIRGNRCTCHHNATILGHHLKCKLLCPGHHESDLCNTGDLGLIGHRDRHMGSPVKDKAAS